MSRFIKSFGFAGNGILYALKTQPNFKIHLALTITTFFAGWYFKLNTAEWLWLIAAIGLVLITELFNTALEVLVNLVSPGFHEKAGIVKDTAAGAVLVAAIIAVLIGLVIFVPKIW
jgi:diacylglycerol kinase